MRFKSVLFSVSSFYVTLHTSERKTDQHISLSECCNDDTVFVSSSKQLFSLSMYNRGKGDRPSMAHPEHTMAVFTWFHPNRIQNNTVSNVQLMSWALTSPGTSFCIVFFSPFSFYHLFLVLFFSFSHAFLSTCPFLRRLTPYTNAYIKLCPFLTHNS